MTSGAGGNPAAREGRQGVVDYLIAIGVPYAVALPAVAFFFTGIVRDRPLDRILLSHLGPFLLLRFPWMGWGELLLLGPFVIGAVVFRWARARGALPVLFGLLVLFWLGVGAFLAFADAVLRSGT